MEKQHQGVGILLSNLEHTQFLLQQKDETYPHKQYRGSLSFWGGAIEVGEKFEAAAWRELEEELPESMTYLKDKKLTFINHFEVRVNNTYSFPFALFELCVEQTLLKKIATMKVEEGKSILVYKNDLAQYTWVWGLEQVMEARYKV
ncbi:MAG: NUDIX hydrolase [Saprospiraceae bacterium]|nr:NUDIX hydrolase [Saprospiraceae bacterium]